MANKPPTILAINPGSKYLGIAVLQGEILKDWRIKVLKGKWSKEKYARAEKIITGLIKYHRPDVLALKKLHASRSSLDLSYLVERIKDMALKTKMPVRQYAIQEIKDFFSPAERINKKGLAGIIAVRLPDLYHDLEKEKARKNPYLLRMFEAVALGIMCFHKLDNQLTEVKGQKTLHLRIHEQKQPQNPSHRSRDSANGRCTFRREKACLSRGQGH
jgi:Holliday junction resolvasome RuvABC endonuclease subunit